MLLSIDTQFASSFERPGVPFNCLVGDSSIFSESLIFHCVSTTVDFLGSESPLICSSKYYFINF